ncbi:MAG TPA: type II toxin-antitoxin system RelE/ParE family toxin [Anaeromyxobacter sp.]|nr:type II toxin-antitoxin system RelE/ParE family toxin [Anaeromyxobacter sp.]
MRVVLHPDAVAEATAAGDWYDAQRPGLGADLADELERALDLILENPQTWPMWPGAPAALGVRRFLLPHFPFGLAYVVRGNEVVILAVAHLRRRPGYWLRRTD